MILKRNTKAADHNSFKLKLHWQLQANDHAYFNDSLTDYRVNETEIANRDLKKKKIRQFYEVHLVYLLNFREITFIIRFTSSIR